MDYALSAEQFLYGKMFDSKGQFSHKTGNRFKHLGAWETISLCIKNQICMLC